jgi:hypothetical protein
LEIILFFLGLFEPNFACIYYRRFFQDSLVSFGSEEKVIASRWLEEYENSTLAYLITDQFYAPWDY